ncbi:hypothetical protein, partial [Ruminococcus callidus]
MQNGHKNSLEISRWDIFKLFLFEKGQPWTSPAFLKNCWTEKLYSPVQLFTMRTAIRLKAIPHKDCATDASSNFS